MLPDIQPGNTKILYFFNCLLDGMHTISLSGFVCQFTKLNHPAFEVSFWKFLLNADGVWPSYFLNILQKYPASL